MFYLVCFDISDDRARYKAGRMLKGFGYRVQKSVYECPNMNKSKLIKLKHKLEELIDQEKDTVRFYQLCKECLGVFDSSGNGEQPRIKDFFVV
ncbi:CRISPR-associated endonuclease Cas2 [Desulfonatronovibrio hydrogenovorans]|uniref:CRISPR-associated endonuclease Cas2 n=1 Tax=Desulfonatronovibrio hydrogenovorans TaxID=53245 RepID=UPI00048E81CC|nr:CRISPR-associated endonuclease Cas2 [Desulfonatronovibrio hydrogenovorans]